MSGISRDSNRKLVIGYHHCNIGTVACSTAASTGGGTGMGECPWPGASKTWGKVETIAACRLPGGPEAGC
jgi:hypothetical protein